MTDKKKSQDHSDRGPRDESSTSEDISVDQLDNAAGGALHGDEMIARPDEIGGPTID